MSEEFRTLLQAMKGEHALSNDKTIGDFVRGYSQLPANHASQLEGLLGKEYTKKLAAQMRDGKKFKSILKKNRKLIGQLNSSKIARIKAIGNQVAKNLGIVATTHSGDVKTKASGGGYNE